MKKTVSFEASMERLQEILHTLEGGGDSLEESLRLYEEGIGLIRTCTTLLETAEQKVRMLQLQPDGSVAEVDFAKGENQA